MTNEDSITDSNKLFVYLFAIGLAFLNGKLTAQFNVNFLSNKLFKWPIGKTAT